MTATTKDMISDAYLAMVNRKSMDKITVKDLVEACGISRQTFYYHFKDLIEVMEWAIDRACEKMLAETFRQPTADKAIGVYVQKVLENREGIRRGLISSKREYIERALFRSLQSYLQTLFRSARPSIPINDTTEQLALQFCAGGLAGILLEYCQKETIHLDELTKQIASFLRAIENVVRSPS